MLILGFSVFTSCDDGLAEMNINPNTNQALTYDAQLLSIELNVAEFRYSHGPMMSMAGAMIQHVASIEVTGVPGDKYWFPGGNHGEHYNHRYSSTVKNLVDLIKRTSEDPEDSNYHNIAKILYAFQFQRITDLYGDVPYSEAGLGYEEGITTPVFDTQESIYMDLLSILDESIPALTDAKKTYDNSDMLYHGNIQKWKKFGYSVMLRLAMRMQKVNSTLAAQWASKAVNGGVMTSNDDIMFTKHDASGSEVNWNGFSRFLQDNFNVHRISNTMITMLESTGDPRLGIYAQPYNGVGPQKGLPNGYDATTIQGYPGGEDLETYSWFNRDLVIDQSSPMIHLTYAEVCFMQAEAVLRGWISGDATELYNKGTAAGIKQWGEIFPFIDETPDAAVTTYLANNPFDNSYEMIGNQMWLVNFLNEYEAYANWRRTGFPVLIPTNYPGNETGGQIPRRLWYGNVEQSLNNENYQAAVTRQGPDTYMTRIWWDTQ